MPWNGSAPNQTAGRTDGVRTGDDVYAQQEAADVDMDATLFDVHATDLKDMINACLKKDGGNTATANLPMGGFTLTNIAAATARTMPARFSQLQDNAGEYVATVGGTADAITLTPSPTITAYAAGQRFTFIASGANTGAATVNVSGVGAKDIKRNDGSATALSAGDIASGAIADIEYDGTNFLLLGRQTNFQPLDSDLTAIAALSTTAAGRTALTYADPNADRIIFWDDSESAFASLALSGLTISTTTLAVDAASDTAAGKIELAVQSEMETATDVVRAVTPGRQHFHPGHPKAGGNLNGTGTPAFVAGDYGMGAVTDNGTGDWTVAFDTAFANTNYWAALAGGGSTDAQPDFIANLGSATDTAAKTASSIVLAGVDATSGSKEDADNVHCTFWGDYA